jgi:hypothetical protein
MCAEESAVSQSARLVALEPTQLPTPLETEAESRLTKKAAGSVDVVPNSRNSIHLVNAKEASVPSATPD